MLGFFVSYYLFRQLGVLAFEGKEGFGGSESPVPQCVYPASHFSYHSGDYWIGHGGLHDRAGIPCPERSSKDDGFSAAAILQTTWGKDRHDFRYALCAWSRCTWSYLVAADRFRMGRLVVWVGLLALIAIVFAVEMAIQRMWPDGGATPSNPRTLYDDHLLHSLSLLARRRTRCCTSCIPAKSDRPCDHVDLWVRALDAYGRDRRTDLRRRLATVVHPLRMPRLRPENRRGRAGRTDERTRGSSDVDRRRAASVGADAALSGSAVPGRDRAGLRARGERVATYDGLLRPRSGARIEWDPDAERRLNNVPAPVRAMARIELERTAADRGAGRITVALMEEVKANISGWAQAERNVSRPADATGGNACLMRNKRMMLHRMALRVLPSLSLAVTEDAVRKQKRLVMFVPGPGRLWNLSSGQTPGAADGAGGVAADQWHCGPADGGAGLPSGTRDGVGSALPRGRQKPPDMDGRMDRVCLCCAAVSSRPRASYGSLATTI